MKPNILFVNPPSLPLKEIEKIIVKENTFSQQVAMPLGIMYLSSYIKSNNEELGEVGILDYLFYINNIAKFGSLKKYIEGLALGTVHFIPDIVAFSLIYSTSHSFVITCIDILKSIWPKATIVIGGVHATNCLSQLLENKNVGYVARGEGEFGFSQFIKQYSTYEKIRVKGFYSRQNFASLSILELCDYVDNLDTLPFPDWNLINMEAYVLAKARRQAVGRLEESRSASIVTTRGCPNRCTFCSVPRLYARKIRFRSVENVVEEVRLLHSLYGVTSLTPEDDLFTANPKRVIALLKSLKALNIPGFELSFPNGLSVNTLNKRVMDALIDAGMRTANIAIESGSEYVQRQIIKKNCNLKKAREVVRYLQDKGVNVKCCFVFGFPSESKEDMQKTLSYSKSLKADWNYFNIAAPLTGSEMYDQFMQMGCIKDEMDVWSNAFFGERVFDTPEISAVDLKEFVYRANLEYNFLKHPYKLGGDFAQAIEAYKGITDIYPFHIIAWYCIMECYREMRETEEAERYLRKIHDLINSDKRAAEMYAKYSAMMPQLNNECISIVRAN